MLQSKNILLTLYMSTSRKIVAYLIVSFCPLLVHRASGQERDSLPRDVGVIHAAKPRLAPYFRVNYVYTVRNTPIPVSTRKRLIFNFRSGSIDTVDRGKLICMDPSRGDLSQLLSRRVHYTFGRIDTPFVDSVRIFFHLSKQGKVTKIFLADNDVLRDSVHMKDWFPKRAHESIELELWKLFDAFLKDQVGQQDGKEQLSMHWKAGGYAKRSKEKPDLTDINYNTIPYRQEFSCALTVIYSSFPQTPYQKMTGVRFVEGDDPLAQHSGEPLHADVKSK
jgi:hypothetical protein